IVAGRIRQAAQAGAVGVGLENVHVWVEIPLVAAALARAALLRPAFVLRGVLLLGVGVEMAAGKDDFLAIRGEITARGLAHTRADTANASAGQVHRENLIKGVTAVLFLRLENDRLSVWREVTLAGPSEIVGDLADTVKVLGLSFGPVHRFGGQGQ